MELQAELIVLGHAAGAVVVGWLYFGRYALTWPPIGVFNLADVALVLCGIVGAFMVGSLVGVEVFPVMVVLGPLMVPQYASWTWLRGTERTT